MTEKTEVDSHHTGSPQGAPRELNRNGVGCGRSACSTSCWATARTRSSACLAWSESWDGGMGQEPVSESLCYLEVPALHRPGAEGAALQFDDLMTMAQFNPLMGDLRMLAQRRSRLQRRSMAGGCTHRRLSASGSNLRWWWIRCSINWSRKVYPCCWRPCRRRCGEMLWGPATFGRCPSLTAFMW